ncbi:hypothetical protein [Streptomyces sp. NPDC020571]|uniref:hypothetical protein n=1 Tax=Streptomyces sp. NPDC020571 TaxID=3365079 RepID=UPI0037972F61
MAFELLQPQAGVPRVGTEVVLELVDGADDRSVQLDDLPVGLLQQAQGDLGRCGGRKTAVPEAPPKPKPKPKASPATAGKSRVPEGQGTLF